MKLVSLETAKALQGLGYDGDCTRWYNRDGMLKSANLVDDDTPAPRLDDAAYFLRDSHGIIAVAEYQSPFGCWNPYTRDTTSSEIGFCGYAKSCDKYEDALEFALKKAIQIIKEKHQ